jgi:ribosomal protein S21
MGLRMRVHDKEHIGAALRRFKKLLERSGMKRELRSHEYYEKPSEAAAAGGRPQEGNPQGLERPTRLIPRSSHDQPRLTARLPVRPRRTCGRAVQVNSDARAVLHHFC